MKPRLYSLLYHVLLSTKASRPLIRPRWQDDLHETLRKAITAAGGVAVAIGGASDHVHLLLSLRPADSPDAIMSQVKTASAAWAKEHDRAFDWQDEYAIFTVSWALRAKLEHFIRGQTAHHCQVKFVDEVAWLLRKNGASLSPTHTEGAQKFNKHFTLKRPHA